MKNKIISLILIITMLLLPFSILLNVKAENIQIITDSNHKVTDVINPDNSHGGVINLMGVNADENAGGTGSFDVQNSDTFKAYKVIDIYFNNNEISYQFTSDFQRFINSLETSFIRTITSPAKDTFTIDDYFKLTSDNASNGYGNYGSENISTSSTLNILVSKYATFIRNNENGSNPVTGLAMTNTTHTFDADSNRIDARLSSVVPGSYLILPDSTAPRKDYDDSYFYLSTDTYGVMIANVFFESNNDQWELINAEVYPKREYSYAISSAYPWSLDALYVIASNYGNMTSEEKNLFQSRSGLNISAASGLKFTYINFSEDFALPTNTNTSIKDNNEIITLLNSTKAVLPAGFTFDYTKAYNSELKDTFTRDGNTFYDDGNVAIQGINSTTVIFQNYGGYLNVDVSKNHNFTAGANNTINNIKYYLKDPYVDIGSNVTKNTVEAAYENENTVNDTDQYRNIRKAIGMVNNEINVVLYGVRVNNKDDSNNNLSGAVFQAYSDPNCTAGNEIGPQFTVSNGVGSFVGINNFDTVYLKQISAPNGYKKYPSIIDLHTVASDETPASGHVKVNATLGADSYYTIEVVNDTEKLLPFTGGVGTIVYVIIGLLIIAISTVFLISYKRKDKKVPIQ